MFKVSDDLDSDDDFLENEFTDDFLCCAPNSVAAKSSFDATGRPRKSCNGADVTPTTCTTNGLKSSTPISKGVQPKTERSPVLLNSADASSTYFKTSPSVVPLIPRHSPHDTRQKPVNDDRILGVNALTRSIEVPYSKPEISSRKSSLSPIASNHSAFLAEWNDDSFFTAPKEKQPSSAPHSVTPEVVTRKANRTIRQRRFPGPAGLLPPRQGSTSLIAPEEFLNELKGEDSDPTYQETEMLSQSSCSVFEGGAWSAMLEDLGASGQPLLKSMNLASIKAIGIGRRSYKVPFLSVLVQSIDASLPDAAVAFKDPTGEMHGVIHRDVWDQFSTDIAVGTVLVLRNVGIISAGVSSRQQVVNITGNNLTAIYSTKDELNIQLRRIHEFAASTSSKLLAEWEKVESQTDNCVSPLSRRVQMQPRSSPLFNGLHGGQYSGNGDSRHFIHPYNHTIGRAISSPTTLGFSSSNRPMAPSFNSTSRPMDPNFNEKNFNQKNGPTLNTNPSYRPMDQGTNPSYRPMDQGTNPRIGPKDRNLNPSNSPIARLNSSSSSPFSPMASTNIENSSLVGNQKFVPKSPFTMKTPASARPFQPPDRTHSTTSVIPNATSNNPPMTSPVLPVKKPKLCHSVPSTTTNTHNSIASKKNPFQVDADSSAIDSLLEGIDADSLFGDF